MTTKPPNYQCHRFSSAIISHAIWLYHRLCLSFREVEDLLAECGVTVAYETVRRWCQKFGPAYVHKGWCHCSIHRFHCAYRRLS